MVRGVVCLNLGERLEDGVTFSDRQLIAAFCLVYLVSTNTFLEPNYPTIKPLEFLFLDPD